MRFFVEGGGVYGRGLGWLVDQGKLADKVRGWCRVRMEKN